MNNIVVIVVDSLRFDGIAYNQRNHLNISSPSVYTPNLDNYAQKGTSFPHVYSSNSFTTAAHASLFTGFYPAKHGIRGFFDFKQQLNPKLPSLAEKLSEKGYNTFFYSDVKELFSEMNIWRGFKHKSYGKINWLWNTLEESKSKKNFVFLHLFDVHEPYLLIKDGKATKEQNEEYYDEIKGLRNRLKINSKINQMKKPYAAWREVKERLSELGLSEREYLKPLYFRGIEHFDRITFPLLKERLAQMGLNDKNSFLMILADHGEGATKIGEINNFHHSGELSEEVIRIPLMVNLPTLPIPKFPISIIDIHQLISNPEQAAVYLNQLNSVNRLVYAEYVEIDKRAFRLLDHAEKRMNTNKKEFQDIKKTLLQRVLLGPSLKYLLSNNHILNTNNDSPSINRAIFRREYPFEEAISNLNISELLTGKIPTQEGANISKAKAIFGY